jgi:hypothetical protein
LFLAGAARRLEVIKRIGLVLIVLGLAACGAQPAGQQAQPPPAIAALIQDLKNQPVANPPAYVASYDYSGQVVYYVPPRCCDIFGNLYDSEGQIICHPDGGIAGHGDGRCRDFLNLRTNETVIWRDTRKAG